MTIYAVIDDFYSEEQVLEYYLSEADAEARADKEAKRYYDGDDVELIELIREKTVFVRTIEVK